MFRKRKKRKKREKREKEERKKRVRREKEKRSSGQISLLRYTDEGKSKNFTQKMMIGWKMEEWQNKCETKTVNINK